MFNEQYIFSGRHALYVDALVKGTNATSSKIFQRNVDVLLVAPVLGFINGRLAEKHTQKDNNGKNIETSVFAERVIGSQAELMYIYQLIMLLDKKYEPDKEKRIEKAFRHPGSDPKDYERFQSYVRGGVEVLYERIIEDCKLDEDVIQNLYDLVENIEDFCNSHS